MLGFEVFIIHLSSSSKEGTCSVPLNYRILLCQLQWDRKECYGWLRETVRYTKFLGFIWTVLFQGRNTARLLFECIRDTFGVGVEILWFFFFPPLPERCLKFDCSCLKKKKKNHWNVLWNVDLQMWIENATFVRTNKELVTQLCRDCEVPESFLFLWFHLIAIGVLLGLDRSWGLDAVWSP